MSLTDLVALVLFAAAGSVSPGPNNTLLLASGVRFGFAHTIPHVIGSAIGIGALILLVGLGIGAAIEGDPGTSSPIQGYAGHYCNVPTRVDPKIVACSMIVSGLRTM